MTPRGPAKAPETGRRHRPLLWVAIAVAAVVAACAVVLAATPTPGALLVRAVFGIDADRLTAGLAVGAPAVDVARDIPYRDGDPDAMLDVYTPVGTTGPLPTIVWTHGGAWLSGTRTDYAGYYQRLADRGFTVVSVGYSLAPEHRHPTAVHQLNDAHAYLVAHADELHVDATAIVLAGDSAGSQLSSQLATAITNPGFAAHLGLTPALDPTSLRGVVLHCGIYNVPAMAGTGGIVGFGINQALWAYTGERDFAGSDAGQLMSTLFHADANFPATFISGGNADPLTDKQSRPLAGKLDQLGVRVDELFFPDDHVPELGHEYQFDLSLDASVEAFERTVAFVDDVTGPR